MQADPGSLVYTAAYHGNVRHLKKLLQRHAKELDSLLKWPHPHGGATAIYVACEFGHKDAVQLLLEAKAPPDQPRKDGATPLYKACQDGKLDIVKLLLKHGAKVDQIDANQMTALWVACHQGHMELAKVLLEAKADPTFKVQDWTPIRLAEREQRNQLVELLLKHAPAGYEEQRQLHAHAHGGDGGAATTTAEQQQAAALQAMGMQQQNSEVIRTHRLYRAAIANDERSVRSMLESAEVVDINAAPGEGGATALYAVCMQGNCSMAQLLLDARASPNIALKNGETALLAATNSSRLDVARLLLEHSADVNACTAHGKTALMVACHRGDGAMARLLLDEGASTGEVLKGKGTGGPISSPALACKRSSRRPGLPTGAQGQRDRSHLGGLGGAGGLRAHAPRRRQRRVAQRALPEPIRARVGAPRQLREPPYVRSTAQVGSS